MSRSSTPLRQALRATRAQLVSAFGISIFVNLTLFAAPLYSLQIYDRVMASRNMGTLVMLTAIVGVFIALYGLLEYARSCVLVRGSVRFNEVLAKPLFELSMRAQLAGHSSAAAQALRDSDTVRDSISSGAAPTLFDVPWTPVFVLVCFLLHPALGWVAFLGAILILACALLTEYLTHASVSTANNSTAESNRFSSGCLRNAETVHGLGMNDPVLRRWLDMQNLTIATQSKATEKAAIVLAFTKVVRMSVQIALLCVGAYLAINRLISPGAMMAAMIIMGRALSPVEQAVANWKRIVAARAALKRLDQLFAKLPAGPVAMELPQPDGELKVDGLYLKTAKRDTPIVSDVSFALKAGSALAIIGPSGGGKSTLVKALAGIWAPSLGSVRLDGAALAHWDRSQLGRNIGYLPQEVEFFAGTIAENIARLDSPDSDALISAAKSAGVHEAILQQPQGYQTVLGDGEVVLSGGMRQRIGLARALYGSPCLLIMDEPNSNLDAEGEEALVQAMRQMKAERRTVVVVTHRPQLLAHVDLVLVLVSGRAQSFGPRDEVLSRMGSKVARLKVQPVSGAPSAIPAGKSAA